MSTFTLHVNRPNGVLTLSETRTEIGTGTGPEQCTIGLGPSPGSGVM